jgi:hypothetical protein
MLVADAGDPNPVGEEIGRVETLAVLAQPLVWAGIGRRFPWALLGLEEEAKLGWGILAVLLLVFGLAAARWVRATAKRRAALSRYAVILLCLCPVLTAGFDFLSSRHFARFGYGPPGALLALDAAILLALVLWLRSPRHPGRGVVIVAIAAAAHRLGSAILFPLDPRRSDMLEVVMHAAGVASAGGQPYVDTLPQGLKYLPGTWLAHAPAVLAGIDPRIPGALLVLGIGLALARSLRGAPAGRTGLAGLLTMLVLLNPYHAFRHDLYFDAFLALTAAIFHLGARGAGTRRSLLSMGILVGLAVATRQWAWVYGPFALLAAAIGVPGAAASKGRRVAILKRLAFASAVAAVVALPVVAPWILQDPAAFWRGAFAFAGESFSEACLGVAGLAAALGVSRVLPVLQATFCIGGFAKALRRLSAPSALATGWLVWAAVVILSPFLENYFYLSLGFAAAALATGASRVIERT